MKAPMGFRPDREGKAPPPPKERWEGYILDTHTMMRVDRSFGPEYEDNVKDIIDDMGDKGWELVTIGPSSYDPKNHDRLVFKRRK